MIIFFCQRLCILLQDFCCFFFCTMNTFTTLNDLRCWNKKKIISMGGKRATAFHIGNRISMQYYIAIYSYILLITVANWIAKIFEHMLYAKITFTWDHGILQSHLLMYVEYHIADCEIFGNRKIAWMGQPMKHLYEIKYQHILGKVIIVRTQIMFTAEFETTTYNDHNPLD